MRMEFASEEGVGGDVADPRERLPSIGSTAPNSVTSPFSPVAPFVIFICFEVPDIRRTAKYHLAVEIHARERTPRPQIRLAKAISFGRLVVF